MNLAELIRKMSDAGAPSEAIALAVEAIEKDRMADADRRAKRAEQKRIERLHKEDVARQSQDSRPNVGAVSQNVAGASQDVAVLSQNVAFTGSPEVSPKDNNQTPILPPPSECDGARERKAAERELYRQAEEFYAVYPKKVDPKAAKAKFLIACRAGVDPVKIISASRRFAEAHQLAGTDKQFIPAPAVWLNRGGYDSEDLPTAPARAGPPAGKPQTNARMDVILESIDDERNGNHVDKSLF